MKRLTALVAVPATGAFSLTAAPAWARGCPDAIRSGVDVFRAAWGSDMS
jgi:hypothetical protein